MTFSGKRIFLLIPIGFLVLGLFGCHQPGDIVGHWQVAVKPSGTGGKDSALAQGLANAFASAMNINFRADHTFTMNMLVSIEGTWSQSGDEVSLIPTKVAGIAPTNNTSQKPMKLRLSADGKTLTDEDSGKGEALSFTKQAPSGSS